MPGSVSSCRCLSAEIECFSSDSAAAVFFATETRSCFMPLSCAAVAELSVGAADIMVGASAVAPTPSKAAFERVSGRV
eukprot:CAMPEP_0202845168 /NCGR_PEP_ID=MMETSP1389-20130828/69312_1 /ASSEMBLY_ACC=CAM_ASM_000865 /TAXON_ID=302021 /ORGANISM="Rhodomonas sp., Strain CCMP768" /LENGTH=77 /DNA_ID=CAMNT_0049522581 /DNA_START=55 /DNA_END=284 /DNA_ORIENTATION=+